MQLALKVFGLPLAIVPLIGLLTAGQVLADITPADDGTGTRVTRDGDRFDIGGGTRSRDGNNLFHSFEQLGLSRSQIANFLADPQLQNILGRVTGGEASVINGLIQMTGGNANLYLLNPAGIIFGANARLNVPGAFTATTADGIGFADGWFSAIGSNNYADLVGNPNRFAFTSVEPGTIVNAGNLVVSRRQTLTLLGGTVINTGTLTAPAGQVTIAAVSGENLVRLSQQGMLLSLDIAPLSPNNQPNSSLLSPLSLPELLTGGNIASATGLIVDANGTVRLTGSGVAIPTDAGTAIASGTINVNGTRGGQVSIFGEQVGLVEANLNASGRDGGGTILVGGDYQGRGRVPTADRTFISSDSILSANATERGNGGRVIVWADDTTRFLGTIRARGGRQSGNGGFVETSGANQLEVLGGSVDARAPQGRAGIWLLDPRNITIRNATTTDGGFGGGDPNIFRPTGDDAVVSSTDISNTLARGTSVTITTGTDGTQAGNIIVEDEIVALGGTGGGTGVATLSLAAASDIRINAPIRAASGGIRLNLRLLAGNAVDINADIATNGGNFGSQSSTFSSTGSTITTGRSQGTDAGNITIRSNDSIVAGILDSSQAATSAQGDAGDVTLVSGADIQLSYINAQSGRGAGGAVNARAIGTFQAFGRITGTSSVDNASIAAVGLFTSGTIVIRQGGSTFTIGDASENGTAGDLLTGSFQSGVVLEAVSAPNAFTEDFTSASGRTQIIFNENSAPPNEPDTPDEPDEPDDFDLPDEVEDFDELDEIDDFEDDSEEIEDFDEGFDDVEVSDADSLDEFDEDWSEFEDDFTGEFEDYLELPDETIETLADTSDTLNQITAAADVKPALVYVSFVPSITSTSQILNVQGEDDQLELVLVTGAGEPIRLEVDGVTRSQVQQASRQLISEITNPRKINTTSYLPPAQQLYQWLIAPLEAELQAQGIQNIAFIAEAGLRSLPLAALHDGQQFLVEKYSIGLMPSLSLTDTRYRDIRSAQVLAMGASEFSDQTPLPAVPIELSTITQLLWAGESFLNQFFTPANLRTQREQQPFGIVHLATHGEFRPGEAGNSYIQFWDQKLRLDQMRQLGLNDPPVDLLVLSACRTALGDEQAELGFAGFAVQAGAKSALASLWYVSDAGTLGFMTEFYRQLREAPIKAEALRQTQIAMLREQVRLENGTLRGSRGSEVVLPPGLAETANQTLSHPFYWASFTMIGSPW